MASTGKKKTTMAKLTRESRLRERRQDKKARKDARKLAAANGPVDSELSLLDATREDPTLPDAAPGETTFAPTTE